MIYSKCKNVKKWMSISEKCVRIRERIHGRRERIHEYKNTWIHCANLH